MNEKKEALKTLTNFNHLWCQFLVDNEDADLHPTVKAYLESIHALYGIAVIRQQQYVATGK